MDSDIPPHGHASVIDGAIAIAKAAEFQAIALVEAATALTGLVEHIRDQTADPLRGVTRQ